VPLPRLALSALLVGLVGSSFLIELGASCILHHSARLEGRGVFAVYGFCGGWLIYSRRLPWERGPIHACVREYSRTLDGRTRARSRNHDRRHGTRRTLRDDMARIGPTGDQGPNDVVSKVGIHPAVRAGGQSKLSFVP
jgi:hypothetical protein